MDTTPIINIYFMCFVQRAHNKLHVFHICATCILTQPHWCIMSICVYPSHLLWYKICHVQWTIRRAFFAVNFCVTIVCILCSEGAATVNSIFFVPCFTFQNIGALHLLQYTVIWHTSCWVWNISFFWDAMLCHWLCSSQYFLWAAWSWGWRHYIPLICQECKHQMTQCHTPKVVSLQQ
jgi:hypothetical protein